MGSACHQLGVYGVLPLLQELIHSHDLDDKIVLKGAFCLGNCSEGVVMKLGDTLFTHLNASNISDRFRNEILPAIQTALRGVR